MKASLRGGMAVLPELRRVEAFADEWHEGPWSLAGLPARLGVSVYRSEAHASLLGMACRAERWLWLNERVADTPAELPILAHECAHLLLPGEGVGECRPWATPDAEERAAWYAAARLAVPHAALALHGEGRSVADIAASLELPTPFVALAQAIHRRLSHDAPPGVARAAVDDWLAWLRTCLLALPATVALDSRDAAPQASR